MLIRTQLKSWHQKVPSSSCAAAFSWISFPLLSNYVAWRNNLQFTTHANLHGGAWDHLEIERSLGRFIGEVWFVDEVLQNKFWVAANLRFSSDLLNCSFESIWLLHKSAASLKSFASDFKESVDYGIRSERKTSDFLFSEKVSCSLSLDAVGDKSTASAFYRRFKNYFLSLAEKRSKWFSGVSQVNKHDPI